MPNSAALGLGSSLLLFTKLFSSLRFTVAESHFIVRLARQAASHSASLLTYNSDQSAISPLTANSKHNSY